MKEAPCCRSAAKLNFMNDTIRVMFFSKEARDCFFDHVNRYNYQFVYHNWRDSARKDVKHAGDPRGDCRLFLDKKSVMNYDRLNLDIQVYGGRVSEVVYASQGE